MVAKKVFRNNKIGGSIRFSVHELYLVFAYRTVYRSDTYVFSSCFSKTCLTQDACFRKEVNEGAAFWIRRVEHSENSYETTFCKLITSRFPWDLNADKHEFTCVSLMVRLTCGFLQH